MKSHAGEKFWKAFENLPAQIQRRSREAYRLWQENPFHPSLQFKQIHSNKPIFSVRVGVGWRAVGIKQDETMIWFWIGSHTEYDKLISKL
ncbi:MAG: hypothetical protein LC768_02315 [Acidobacteria bacterium]|nr:hypothetical protein [Acidobacteriota bacterium]MCA1637166.1 hypothetical protein [Acidobacteriota bacterium]